MPLTTDRPVSAAAAVPRDLERDPSDEPVRLDDLWLALAAGREPRDGAPRGRPSSDVRQPPAVDGTSTRHCAVVQHGQSSAGGRPVALLGFTTRARHDGPHIT
jgi:hypothetical protein